MNKSTYNHALTWKGTSVAARTNIMHTGTMRAADTTDLGDYVGNNAATNIGLDVTAEATYKNQSGRKWTLTVGSFTGADIYNIAINGAAREVDVTDNADYLQQRVPGPGQWTVTGSARYNATTHFLSQLRTAASGAVSLAVKVQDAQGSTVLSGTGRVTRGGFGGAVAAAVDQPIEVSLNSVGSIGASALFLKWLRQGCSGVASQACKIANGAAVAQLSGTGFLLAATITAPQDGAVTQTMRAAINTATVLL